LPDKSIPGNTLALALKISWSAPMALPHEPQLDRKPSCKLMALLRRFFINSKLHRQHAFAKGTTDSARRERVAKACRICPSTDKAEFEAALALGHTAVTIDKSGVWNQLAIVMAEYRSGN
jgi:hypothetical protein